MAKGLQVTADNPIDGLEGRTSLLVRLADALLNQEIFGPEARPGNMLDYLLAHPSTHASSVPVITLPTLWDTLMNGLATIWPATRTQIAGVPLGDACVERPGVKMYESLERARQFLLEVFNQSLEEMSGLILGS